MKTERYTLSDRKHETLELYLILNRGIETNAFASVDVTFSDKCEISGGIFRGGEFHGGEFHGGEFRDGIFRGGYFHGGEFHGGEFHGGEFHGGEFRDGIFRDGIFRGGYFRGGYFHGGIFRGGEFHGGIFRGGEFHGGYFHGGYFHGGYFRGGEFHGGYFHGGYFRGGYLPTQIQGSMHFVNSPDGINIKIGCIENTPIWWKENSDRVGKIEKYTYDQIKEYKSYVDLFSKLIKGDSDDVKP